jgi:hypothetical protein
LKVWNNSEIKMIHNFVLEAISGKLGFGTTGITGVRKTLDAGEFGMGINPGIPAYGSIFRQELLKQTCEKTCTGKFCAQSTAPPL